MTDLFSAYDRKQAVRTLTASELDDEAARLYELVLCEGPPPSHIVGIARAGVHVAAAMMKAAEPHVVRLEITARRATTGLKERLPIRGFAQRLPISVSDRLRRLENRLITRHLSPERAVSMPPNDARELVCAADSPTILLVDDCVDTGASLLAAFNYLESLAGPQASLTTAALTVSIENPLMRPRWNLYENMQFRGPWSYDG